jgi:DnaJ-class molecular chaperone
MPAEPVPAPGAAPTRPGDEAAPGTPQSAETTCPLCGGSGSVDNNGVAVMCPECEGSGRVTVLVGDA